MLLLSLNCSSFSLLAFCRVQNHGTAHTSWRIFPYPHCRMYIFFFFPVRRLRERRRVVAPALIDDAIAYPRSRLFICSEYMPTRCLSLAIHWFDRFLFVFRCCLVASLRLTWSSLWGGGRQFMVHSFFAPQLMLHVFAILRWGGGR